LGGHGRGKKVVEDLLQGGEPRRAVLRPRLRGVEAVLDAVEQPAHLVDGDDSSGPAVSYPQVVLDSLGQPLGQDEEHVGQTGRLRAVHGELQPDQ